MVEGKLSKKETSEQKHGSTRGERRVSIVSRADEFVDRTLRCRYEMKYLISEAKAEAILQFIKPYLQEDRYCKLQRGGTYPIVSLYLDSGDLHLCRESLTGQKNRFKLRIRSYTDEPDYPRFFEIKRRINNVIIKSRARVMDRYVRTLLAGLPLPPQDYTTDEEAISQFQLYVKSIGARPVVLVRYMRRAYENNLENKVRVTFDRELCYNITDRPEVSFDGQGWLRNSLCLDGVILEIKFTSSYPAWLSRMVEYFNLRSQSISKYATSIKQSCLMGFCAPRY